MRFSAKRHKGLGGSKHFSDFLVRLIEDVERWSNLAGSWLVFFLMLLVTADIGSRYLIRKSIVGVYNLVELVLVAVCYFTAAYCQKQKGHIRLEIVVEKLKGKPRYFMESMAYLLCFAICMLLFYTSIVEAQLAIDIRLTTMGIVEWPAWPFKIVLAYGFFLLSIRIGIQFIQQVGLLLREDKGHEL